MARRSNSLGGSFLRLPTERDNTSAVYGDENELARLAQERKKAKQKPPEAPVQGKAGPKPMPGPLPPLPRAHRAGTEGNAAQKTAAVVEKETAKATAPVKPAPAAEPAVETKPESPVETTRVVDPAPSAPVGHPDMDAGRTRDVLTGEKGGAEPAPTAPEPVPAERPVQTAPSMTETAPPGDETPETNAEDEESGAENEGQAASPVETPVAEEPAPVAEPSGDANTEGQAAETEPAPVCETSEDTEPEPATVGTAAAETHEPELPPVTEPEEPVPEASGEQDSGQATQASPADEAEPASEPEMVPETETENAPENTAHEETSEGVETVAVEEGKKRRFGFFGLRKKKADAVGEQDTEGQDAADTEDTAGTDTAGSRKKGILQLLRDREGITDEDPVEVMKKRVDDKLGKGYYEEHFPEPDPDDIELPPILPMEKVLRMTAGGMFITAIALLCLYYI